MNSRALRVWGAFGLVGLLWVKSHVSCSRPLRFNFTRVEKTREENAGTEAGTLPRYGVDLVIVLWKHFSAFDRRDLG